MPKSKGKSATICAVLAVLGLMMFVLLTAPIKGSSRTRVEVRALSPAEWSIGGVFYDYKGASGYGYKYLFFEISRQPRFDK